MSLGAPSIERGRHLLPVAMLLVSFAWGFAYVGLPFHIQDLGAGDPASTLAWTGWILGITSLTAVASTPLWARLAGRRDPRTACVVVQALQGVGFGATVLARSLLELFAARLALGVVGSTSTFAFILASRAPDPAEQRRRLSTIQSAIMLGQVFGPLAGAVAGARLGLRATFGVGGLILAGCGGLIQWGVPRPTETADATGPARRLPLRDVALASAVVLVASSQEAFLAAVLPQVLPGLGIAPQDMLEVGGALIFASGAAAAAGGLAAPRMADAVPERRLLGWLLAASSVALAALGAAHSVWLFAAIRVLQSLCVAPLFPLVVARVARHASADAIGFVNAARVGSSFVGPVVATTVLGWGPPAVLYVLLGLAGLASVPLARR